MTGPASQRRGGPVRVGGRGGGGGEGARQHGRELGEAGLRRPGLGWRGRRARPGPAGVRRFQGWVPGRAARPRSRRIRAMMLGNGQVGRGRRRVVVVQALENSACSASASAPSVLRWMQSSTARMTCLRARRRRRRPARRRARLGGAGRGRRACGRGRWCGGGCGRCGRRRWWGRGGRVARGRCVSLGRPGGGGRGRGRCRSRSARAGPGGSTWASSSRWLAGWGLRLAGSGREGVGDIGEEIGGFSRAGSRGEWLA